MSTSKNKEIDISEEFTSKGLLAIKPLVPDQEKNSLSIGLEKYGLVLFPGSNHSEPLAFKMVGSKRVYITGLDENSSSVTSITDETKRKAKIKNIRQTVAYLEKTVNYNNLDIEDPDFWSKVQTFRPDNSEYYKTIKVTFNNDDRYLFPEQEVLDLVLYHAIKAGGFSSCAGDIDQCRSEQKRWYLSVEKDVEEVEISAIQYKNRAIVSLEELDSKQNNEMLYICKILMNDAAKYSYNTSRKVLYKALSDYLDGNKQERKIHKAVANFAELLKLKQEELCIRALIADCYYYKKFVHRNGVIIDQDTKTNVGQNTEEVVQYFLDPLNQDHYLNSINVMKEKKWW